MATTNQRLDEQAKRITTLEQWRKDHVANHAANPLHSHDIQGEGPQPVPEPPPAGSWFGLVDPWTGKPFRGYQEGPPTATTSNPNGGIWIGGNKGGAVALSKLTFRNRPVGRNVLVMDGLVGAVLEDLDFDTIPEAIYFHNCHDLTIRRVRARNVFGPYTRLGKPTGNLFQFDNCWNILVEDVKLIQPAVPEPPFLGWDAIVTPSTWGTEDIVSIGGPNVDNVVIRRFGFDGGGWNSHSGTGFLVGDSGTGRNITVEHGILVNPGQVAIGTGEVGPYPFSDIRIRADRGNVGIQHRSALATYAGVKVDWPGGRVITDAAGRPITVPGVTAANLFGVVVPAL